MTGGLNARGTPILGMRRRVGRVPEFIGGWGGTSREIRFSQAPASSMPRRDAKHASKNKPNQMSPGLPKAGTRTIMQKFGRAVNRSVRPGEGAKLVGLDQHV